MTMSATMQQATAVDRVMISDCDAPATMRTCSRDPLVEIDGLHWTAWVRSGRPSARGWRAWASDDGEVIAKGTVVNVSRTGGRLRLDVEPPDERGPA